MIMTEDFLKSEAWSFALIDGGEIRDFAEVWVDANRSRALILLRYLSDAAAAVGRGWKRTVEGAAGRATPGSPAGRAEMAIVEKRRSLNRQLKMTRIFGKAAR
jgi:hypothetical protein